MTVEADTVLDWVPAPLLAEDASADERFGSILAVTAFGGDAGADGPVVTVSSPAVRPTSWADLLA